MKLKKISLIVIMLGIMLSILSCANHPKQLIAANKFSFSQENTVIWIGHATTLFKINGLVFITDPVLTDCLTVLKRKNRLGLKRTQLPNIDVILISHAHIDHFHKNTLKSMPKNTKIILPSALVAEARALGFNQVYGMTQGETVQLGAIKIIAKPVKHAVPSLSYVIEGNKTIYFGGDSAYFDGYKTIGQDYKIDMALLPIGPIHAESLKAHHLTPAQAITAFNDLRALAVLPIHHSTFRQGPAMLWPFFDIADEINIFKQLLLRNGLLQYAAIVKPGVEVSF